MKMSHSDFVSFECSQLQTTINKVDETFNVSEDNLTSTTGGGRQADILHKQQVIAI